MGDLDATNPVEVKTNNEGGIQFSKFDRCFWYLSYAFEFTTGIIFFAFLCIVSPSSCQLMKYQFTLALIVCFLQILTVNTIYKGPQSMRIIISTVSVETELDGDEMNEEKSDGQLCGNFFGYDDLPLLGTYMLESIITMFVVIIVGDFIPPNYEFMQNQMVIMLMLSLLNNCNVIKIVAKKFRWITVSFMYFHIIWKFYCFLTIPIFLVIVTDPRENCSEEIHGCVELFGGDAFLTKMLVGMTAQLVLGGNLLVEIKRFSLSTFKPEKREISNIVSLCTPQRATQIV